MSVGPFYPRCVGRRGFGIAGVRVPRLCWLPLRSYVPRYVGDDGIRDVQLGNSKKYACVHFYSCIRQL